MWLGGLTGPLLRWSDLAAEDASFLASVAQGGFLVFTGGLVAGSHLPAGSASTDSRSCWGHQPTAVVTLADRVWPGGPRQLVRALLALTNREVAR